MDNKALVPVQNNALIRPVVRADDLIGAHKEIAHLINNALEEGVDFGVIPGTGQKPTLLKPGAERLAIAFGTFPRYFIIDAEVNHHAEVKWSKLKKNYKTGQKEEITGTSLGLYRYLVKCELIRRSDGFVVADAIGSCSSLENKYIDRPRDCENVCLKMAQKRALVAACLNGFGLSDRFTQDVEDYIDVPTEKKSPNEDFSDIVAAFAKIGVSVKQIEEKINKQFEKWELKDRETLRELYVSMKAKPSREPGEEG